MSQSVTAMRAALFSACTTLYENEEDGTGAKVMVSLGRPGTYQPNYIVAVAMATRQPVTRPTMGPARSRERMVEMDVTFSTFVAGGDEATDDAADACDRLVDMLESWLRVSPNEKMDDSVTDSWVSNIDGPSLFYGQSSESGGITGRVAESIVTITARIRY